MDLMFMVYEYIQGRKTFEELEDYFPLDDIIDEIDYQMNDHWDNDVLEIIPDCI